MPGVFGEVDDGRRAREPEVGGTFGREHRPGWIEFRVIDRPTSVVDRRCERRAKTFREAAVNVKLKALEEGVVAVRDVALTLGVTGIRLDYLQKVAREPS